MKPRPPTLREKRRYILVRIDPQTLTIDGRELYYAIVESVTDIYGDTGMARMQPSVVSCANGYAIIRCTRSTEEEVTAGLAAVSLFHEKKMAVRSILTSGTMRSLRQYLIGLKERVASPGAGCDLPGETPVPRSGTREQRLIYLKKDLKTRNYSSSQRRIWRSNHATTSLSDGV